MKEELLSEVFGFPFRYLWLAFWIEKIDGLALGLACGLVHLRSSRLKAQAGLWARLNGLVTNLRGSGHNLALINLVFKSE